MKFIKRLLIFTVVCTILGVGTIFGFYLYVKPELPDVATLRDVKLQTPMQVYSQDGKLISQFGEKRRIPVKYDEIPPHLVEALIATEDSRFYDHYGIDPIGITRAAIVVAMSGSAKQGASTITQQLARNFFLSNEKKIMRKIKEIFIAIHIEQLLSKQEIMELYVNKIFLGHRSYGFGAAARVYFGKDLNQLTLSEIATLAGMPKAPSTMNPIYSIERATNRRNVVLLRMLDEKYITQQEYDEARAETLISRYHGAEIELSAPYVAELARAWMVERYGEDAYTSGMNVYTTVNSKLQSAANDATINNLLAYDERHGYRGAEKVLWKPDAAALSSEEIDKVLRKVPTYGELTPAVVTAVADKSATVTIKNVGDATLEWDGIKWARQFRTDKRQGPAPKKAADVLAVGEQIWVRQIANQQAEGDVVYHWQLSQVPNANTAFVAMNPENGAVMSLVGGFNFVHNKFNRATMSVRQVGSSIKPFIYSAAIDKGLTLATLINDAPINQWDQSQGTAWRPKNSPPTYVGPTRLRIGLAQSKNVMAVRVLREVGLDDTRNYLTRFGFAIDDVPRSETIALGAGSLTPMKMAQGYSVFANGGYYVEPYYIERVEGPYGDLEFQAEPKTICKHNCPETNFAPVAMEDSIVNDNEFNEQDIPIGDEEVADTEVTSPYAPQVISEQTAFLVREMMYSNIWGGGSWRDGTGWNGTGWRAQKLKRRDIGGKTGTTNDSKDTWYNGYGPGVVAIAWVGFDDHSRTLGRTTRNANLGKDQITGAESGAKTAEPAWIDFMHTALSLNAEQDKVIPSGIVRIRIDRDSGLLTNKADGSTMFEYFREGHEPTEYASEELTDTIYTSDEGEELF
ncbi:penicillin-binding protein 1A [Vibrio panuliri]|uniref:Penicillin-binding protein 1A n=1 Tax=Vibrio panuliri TaxID=1381081 RepID=A0ABX3F7G5_9VIBR|nr:PBP1A family penicillin-binding protein [Vibrio panuliri]KAB1459119.1 PBP1A family penicillin-binding protein [Vibrio panuliri]OLQ84993.1 penicillin-sensitive transpeptidase [Vibrio panuliri]